MVPYIDWPYIHRSRDTIIILMGHDSDITWLFCITIKQNNRQLNYLLNWLQAYLAFKLSCLHLFIQNVLSALHWQWWERSNTITFSFHRGTQTVHQCFNVYSPSSKVIKLRGIWQCIRIWALQAEGTRRNNVLELKEKSRNWVCLT